MNYLEKLLDGAQVEWKMLGEIIIIIPAPSKLKREAYCNVGKIPIIDQGATFVAGYTDEDLKVLALSEYIIFGDHSEHIKYIDFAFIQGADVLKIFKPVSDIPKYIYYAFQNFYQKELHYKRHWYRASKTLIPIPCPNDPKKSLAIQAEIVRILDSFTKQTAELTAEFKARKKQYNYYREHLFCFNDNKVQHLPMGQDKIGQFIRGGGLQKKDFTETGVGCIHYGQIYTYYCTYTDKTKTFVSEEFAKKSRKAKTGDLVITTTSENDEDVCKAVAWLGNDDIAISSDACIYRHNLNPKYASYFFQTEQFQKKKNPYITGTKVRRVNADDLSKILIPIPSLTQQARIVSILDKFDILTNSISEWLQKEIELRQKQYEYYRNLLFNFKKF